MPVELHNRRWNTF